MNNPSSAEALIAAGDPAGALAALQQQVRSQAADVRLRVFLFQLLAVLGQWQRAADQLKVCAELDAGTLAMVHTYGAALPCEAQRDAVFAGRTAPHLFGPPAAWVAPLVQALQLDAAGEPAQAARLRAKAMADAPATAGTLNGEPFEWIADADSRLGPVLEVIIDGHYGWLPFEHFAELRIEPVADLRDLVWACAQLRFAEGGESVALLPVRYVGSTALPDAALQMARRTDWQPLAGAGPEFGDDIGSQFSGLGQRVFSTDSAELGLLDVRHIVMAAAAA